MLISNDRTSASPESAAPWIDAFETTLTNYDSAHPLSASQLVKMVPAFAAWWKLARESHLSSELSLDFDQYTPQAFSTGLFNWFLTKVQDKWTMTEDSPDLQTTRGQATCRSISVESYVRYVEMDCSFATPRRLHFGTRRQTMHWALNQDWIDELIEWNGPEIDCDHGRCKSVVPFYGFSFGRKTVSQ
jgi:hypothetical protein